MSKASNEHGDREVRTFGGFEIRHSGRPDEEFTLRGYPIVYGEKSHDLGGFREIIAPGALDEVLANEPRVHLTWDHDTRYVGASTDGGTLELRSDPHGLFIDAQVGKYSWSKDLKTALDRKDIQQGSFAFTVAPGGDEFDVDEETGAVTRTINQIGQLFDVTVTAQGAYPQTSLAAVRSLADAIGRQDGQDDAAGATPVVPPGEGGSESQEGSEGAEMSPAKEALMAKATLRRQELAALKERIDRL